MVSFKGAHFVKDIILTCVRWYVAYPLSYRHVEELMQERGVSVDHATINRTAITPRASIMRLGGPFDTLSASSRSLETRVSPHPASVPVPPWCCQARGSPRISCNGPARGLLESGATRMSHNIHPPKGLQQRWHSAPQPRRSQRAEEKGVHDAREAAGHPSDRDIWRGVTPDRQTLAEAIDTLERS